MANLEIHTYIVGKGCTLHTGHSWEVWNLTVMGCVIKVINVALLWSIQKQRPSQSLIIN